MKVKTLLSPIHDPDERLLDPLRDSISELLSLYEHMVFDVSRKTSPKLTEFLKSCPHTSIVPSNGYGVGARNAFREALGFNDPYHWIDCDRILHWHRTYPDELKRVLENPLGKLYTILGRTPRARLTHPSSWTHCEMPCNRLASRRFGIEVDICVANLLLARNAVESIIEDSSAENWGILTEWPLIVSRHFGKNSLGYMEVEGNDWEDPDYYQKEIALAGGLETWKAQRYDSETEWLKRFQNSIDIVTPMLKHQ